MNKYDLLLIVFLITVSFSFIFFSKSEEANLARVIYDGNVVMEIDMSKDGFYEVDGYLGVVSIQVFDSKIRVVEETSPLNICSKKGFVSNTNDVIVCLPNKVVIEFLKNDIDAVIY